MMHKAPRSQLQTKQLSVCQRGKFTWPTWTLSTKSACGNLLPSCRVISCVDLTDMAGFWMQNWPNNGQSDPNFNWMYEHELNM